MKACQVALLAILALSAISEPVLSVGSEQSTDDEFSIDEDEPDQDEVYDEADQLYDEADDYEDAEESEENDSETSQGS